MRRKAKVALAVTLALAAALAIASPWIAERFLGHVLWSDTTWRGVVHVEGDTFVPLWVTLTVEAGTRVVVAAGRDASPSPDDGEIPADGFNDEDPTRLAAFGRSHAVIDVAGRFVARGTAEAPVVFTSGAAAPGLADWTGLVLSGDGHRVDHLVVEHAKFGLAVPSHDAGVLVRNSTARHALWGCFSLDGANGRFEDLHAEDCGHEGYDVNGAPLLARVVARDAHAGFVVLGGRPTVLDSGSGEAPDGPGLAGARIERHTVDPALACAPDRVWRWGDYVIPCRGEPRLEPARGAP